MIGTEEALPGRESLLDQRDRVGDPACLSVGAGQVAPRAHGVRIVGTQQPLPSGQGLLEQLDRLRQPACVLIDGREAVARVQREKPKPHQHPA